MAGHFSSCFPLRMCLECVQGPSFTATNSYAQLKEENKVKLDTSFIGEDVVVLKAGERICGTGCALANTPIVQSKAYFQVNIQQTGIWAVGIATREVNLNALPNGKHCWVLRNDGSIFGDGELTLKVEETIEEGDSIGVAFDHIDLVFYHNGKPMNNAAVQGIKGAQQLYPIVYVDDSAILDVKFRSFSFTAPHGFEEIMIEQTLL